MSKSSILPFGVASLCGRRSRQEDAHFTICLKNSLVFGLFDGHGGSEGAMIASEVISAYFNSIGQSSAPASIVRQSFKQAHTRIRDAEGGTTAVIAYIAKNVITCGWAGDSRCVIISRGEVRQLTTDHRLNNETERNRILEIGGPSSIEPPYVWLPGGSGLMMTRALGDHEFLEVGVIPDPEITSYALRAGDRFCILICDGVWEVVSDQQLYELTKDKRSPQRLAELIADMAYRNGSTDNITVVVCKLQ